MVSPIFGISKREIHSEEVAYDHSCGGVQPGDYFTKDLSKVTCARCIKKFTKEVLERTFKMPVAESDAQIVLDRLIEFQAVKEAAEKDAPMILTDMPRPWSEGDMQSRPTKRAPDVCPVCGGDGVQSSGVRGQRQCAACDGTGQRG